VNAPFVAIRLAARTRAGQRLARHLWRMCFALFIAAGSFFSIRERVTRVFPEPFTTGRMRALPILLLFGTMFYWLWRVRRRTPPVLVRYDSTPLPSEVTLAASFGMPYIRSGAPRRHG